MKKVLLLFCLISLSLSGNIYGEHRAMDDYTVVEKTFLLNLARAALFYYLKDGSIPKIDEKYIPVSLKQHRGCFVTLEKKSTGLRGCIGYISAPDKPLYKAIIDRAIAAATYDPRFPKVQEAELKDIKIEISILTTPNKLDFKTPNNLLEKLRPNIDGVILQTPYGSSTYLPQVWEHFDDKKSFMDNLSAKHGAPYNIWAQKPEDISVSIYQAIVFGEENFGNIVVGKNGAVVGKNGAKIIGKVTLEKDKTVKTVVEKTVLEPLTVLNPNSDIIDN